MILLHGGQFCPLDLLAALASIPLIKLSWRWYFRDPWRRAKAKIMHDEQRKEFLVFAGLCVAFVFLTVLSARFVGEYSAVMFAFVAAAMGIAALGAFIGEKK